MYRSYDMPDEKQDTENIRESFWNIGQNDRLWFSFWALIFFIFGSVVYVWYEIAQASKPDIHHILFISVKAIGPAGLFAFTLTFFIFEGRDTMNWALERFFEKRREEGRQEGLQEGRQEILDAIKKAYPEIDLSIIHANNGAEKDSDEKKN